MSARLRIVSGARLRAVLSSLLVLGPFASSAQAESAAGVLAAAREASGGAAWARVALVRGVGEETFAGLHGRWSLTEDTVNGRYAQVEDFGVFRTSEGFDGNRHWRQDRSGAVHALDSAFAVRSTRTDAWLARRAYLKPQDLKPQDLKPQDLKPRDLKPRDLKRQESKVEDIKAANVDTAWSSVMERTENGALYLVLQARPAGAEPVELWFDESHRLARIVRQMPISVLVERLEDYRDVDGVSLPFRIVFSDESGGSPAVIAIDRYEVARDEGDGAFVAPEPPDDTRLDRPTRVPAEIDGQIVVRAMINGQGPFGFIVDTGGHNILTPAAASALGLKAVGQGQAGGAGEGTLPEQAVRVSELRIGAARMTDQYFSVIPLTYDTVERGSRPPLAGLLGLEIFERFIVRIDYRRAALELVPTGTTLACAHEPVAIRFEDDSPEVEGTLDGVAGVMAVDTGNGGSTVIQGVWAARHDMAARLKRGLETVSFGSGGMSRNWVSAGHALTIGGHRVRNTEFRYAEDAKGAFSSRTEAANIGYDVLANFTVTFDYARRRMCLVPSPGFAPPPMNRSGLGLSKSEPGAFTVALVRAGSPGARAGIREGDKVVAIDGRAAAKLSGHDAFKAVRRKAGTRVRLTIRRGASLETVTFALEEPR